MSETSPPRFTALGADAGRLFPQLAEMLSARRELAELEVRTDVASAKRLAVGGAIGAVLALCGLPLLLVAAAETLAVQFGHDHLGWLLGLGIAAIVIGLLIVWRAWRRFRTSFIGLEQSLAELKEDLAWLREWAGKMEAHSPGDDASQ